MIENVVVRMKIEYRSKVYAAMGVASSLLAIYTSWKSSIYFELAETRPVH